MSMQWTEDLAVGTHEIDEQHREIFRRGNLLVDACRSGRGRSEIAKMIDFLAEYIQTHFTAEEALHRHHNYPRRAEHREQHAAFERHYKSLAHHLAERGSGLELVVLTNRVVFDWLVKHISHSDRAFAEFLRGK